MTNSQLIVIAIILVAVAVWWSTTRTSAAWAPTVLAIIMLAMAVGGPIWEWSKWAGGSGLPPIVRAAPFGESIAAAAFLWASIGAGLSALLVPQASAAARENKIWLPSKSISISVIVVAAISFAGFVIGCGSSFLVQEVYGQFDGNPLYLRVFATTGVVWGLVALALIAVEKDRKLRYCMIGISILWFIGSIAIGSRTAVAYPLLAAALIMRGEISKRRIHLPMIAAALALLAASILTFSVSFQARFIPLGLLNLANVVEFTISNTLASTDSFLLPVKQLASSVFVSFPDAEHSATYDVGLDVLIANANPLPGTAQPAELERYWPYEWVPLSFAGTWFGATGWAGQFLLFGTIGWMSGYTAYNLQSNRFHLVSFLPVYNVALIAVISAQYSSRMVWRLVSIGMFLLIASYLVRRYHAREGIKCKEQLNPQAIGNKVNVSITRNDFVISSL